MQGMAELKEEKCSFMSKICNILQRMQYAISVNKMLYVKVDACGKNK